MAQNITLMGANYPNVPSVLLPKTGGGTAQFYDMDGAMAWMGKDAELYLDNFYTKEFSLSETLYNGWTPSTTAKDIVASVTAGTFSAANMSDYEYYIVWDSGVDPVYTGSPTLKALTQLSRAYQVQQIFRRPSSWVNIGADNFNSNVCGSVYTSTFLRYYGTTTGTSTYSWAQTYGFYFTVTAATLSNTTAESPTVTVKTPKLSARCSTTYLSTTNANLIDQNASLCYITCKIYRVKRNGVLRGVYEGVVNCVNTPHAYLPFNFKIGAETYQANYGMAWWEWLGSAFDTIWMVMDDDGYIMYEDKYLKLNGSNVYQDDLVVKNAEYTLA